MSFSNTLNRLIRERGITNYRLAKELGVSQSTIAGWRAGKFPQSEDTLNQLAEYLGVSVGALMGGNEDELPRIPHENLRQVVSEDGIHIFLDESSGKMSDNDWEEVMEFIRFKQRRYGH